MRRIISVICAVLFLGGVGLAGAELLLRSGPPAPSAYPTLTPISSSASPPSPAPVDIPPGMPTSLTVKTQAATLIDHVPMDPNQLTVRSDGGVHPGDQPGLYVANGTSSLPATQQQGTVIIGCHALANPPMVCNPLMQLTPDDVQHSQVILGMPQGELVYNIEAIYLVDKTDLPTQHALADNRPGRVELITCDVEGGNNTFQNRIVVACDSSHVGCSA